MIELFKYALAEDMVNHLHAKQPGDRKGVAELQRALEEAQETAVIPLLEKSAKSVSEDEIDAFIALAKMM